VVTGLVAGTTNFFSVREFNAAWNESDMSPEVRWLVRSCNAAPTLNAIADVPNLNINTSQTISLSGITSGSSSEKQTLKITVVSSNLPDSDSQGDLRQPEYDRLPDLQARL